MTTTEGFRCGTVAIVGCPNVGKSTLLNALVGQKISITSAKPQTTRLPIRGIRTFPAKASLTESTPDTATPTAQSVVSGAQFVFVDTPGFQQKHRNALNDRLNQSVQNHLTQGIDAVLWVVCCGRYGPMDKAIRALLPSSVPIILIISQIDRIADKQQVMRFISDMQVAGPFHAVVPVSAHKGVQLDAIFQELYPLMPVQAAIYEADEMTTHSSRFLVAELVREKVFRAMDAEIPYGAYVAIDEYEVLPHVTKISVSIVVSRASHRPMLLGPKGAQIKQIAQQARREMEQLLGQKVFLQTWIKVREGARDDVHLLLAE